MVMAKAPHIVMEPEPEAEGADDAAAAAAIESCQASVKPAEQICAICQEPMTQGAPPGDDEPVYLPCAHSFHAACLRRHVAWRASHGLEGYMCPLCKLPTPLTPAAVMDRGDGEGPPIEAIEEGGGGDEGGRQPDSRCLRMMRVATSRPATRKALTAAAALCAACGCVHGACTCCTTGKWASLYAQQQAIAHAHGHGASAGAASGFDSFVTSAAKKNCCPDCLQPWHQSAANLQNPPTCCAEGGRHPSCCRCCEVCQSRRICAGPHGGSGACGRVGDMALGGCCQGGAGWPDATVMTPKEAVCRYCMMDTCLACPTACALEECFCPELRVDVTASGRRVNRSYRDFLRSYGEPEGDRLWERAERLPPNHRHPPNAHEWMD